MDTNSNSLVANGDSQGFDSDGMDRLKQGLGRFPPPRNPGIVGVSEFGFTLPGSCDVPCEMPESLDE
tara:strand:+ start:311 stop:511 length:201 start_codon:yes stop_codon:yes gene_type:complete